MSQPRPSPLYIRVLVMQHGEQWLAQALDHNLSAQGSSDKQAIQSFIRILRARLIADSQRGKAPLHGLPPAPDRFFDLWEQAEREHDGLTMEPAFDPNSGAPPAYVIKQIVQNDGADLH